MSVVRFQGRRKAGSCEETEQELLEGQHATAEKTTADVEIKDRPLRGLFSKLGKKRIICCISVLFAYLLAAVGVMHVEISRREASPGFDRPLPILDDDLEEATCARPKILMDLNSANHFSICFSLIHWFSGGDLPFHSPLGSELHMLMERVRKCGSEMVVAPTYGKLSSDRVNIILHRFPLYKGRVRIGDLRNPDLHIVLTNEAHLRYWWNGIISGRRNNPKFLLINHNWHSWWLDDFTWLHSRQVGLHTWSNVWALTPTCPELPYADVHCHSSMQSAHWLFPTFFPFPKADLQSRPSTSDPVFCFQSPDRRDMAPLAAAFRECRHCKYSFASITGKPLVQELEPYRPNMLQLNDMWDDEAYHLVFQQCTHLLPMLNENSDHAYLDGKEASTMAYGIGFEIPFIVWYEAYKAYPMTQGYVYNTTRQLVEIIQALAGADEHSRNSTLDAYRRGPIWDISNS